MKTNLLPVLLAGALWGAVSLPAKDPLPNGCPSEYELVSTTTLSETMGGFRNVTWQSFLARDPVLQRLKNRAHVWLRGSFTVATGSGTRIRLHELGAQHRAYAVLLRVTPKDPAKTARLSLVEKHGFPVNVPQNPLQNKPSAQGSAGKALPPGSMLLGFYWIEASVPKQAGADIKFENAYELALDDDEWTLDVFFIDHLPGRGNQQLEDGGPPPAYPDNLN